MRVFPEAVPDIAGAASALADPTRAGMCAALVDGRAWTVGELARYAGVARSTATEHVDVLVRSGIVADVRQGRHRYVRLAGPRVADVIESLGVIARSAVATPHSLNAGHATDNLRAGRTCYRHLAGRLGVILADRLRATGRIDDRWTPTPDGRDLFSGWGVPESTLSSGKGCLDATERRFHLAGPLGVAVCAALFARGWIARIGDTRAVRPTPAGAAALAGVGLLPLGAVDAVGRAS